MAKFNRGKLMTSALLILSGFIVGILASIYLFAIDVDLLAVPYVNKGVKITKDLEVVQNDLKLHIPKGAQMLFTRKLPSSNEYCILINSYWDEESTIEAIGSKPKYFELEEPTK